MSKKYYWVAGSNDGSFTDESKVKFDTKKEAYIDMRNAVLEKMKWNTEFDEDFETGTDVIGYDVEFSQDAIVHSSYSGVYTYEIRETSQTIKVRRYLELDVEVEKYDEMPITEMYAHIDKVVAKALANKGDKVITINGAICTYYDSNKNKI